MISEQTKRNPQAPEAKTERARDHLADPKDWMKVSTFDILELSEEEMKCVAGARPRSLKIDV